MLWHTRVFEWISRLALVFVLHFPCINGARNSTITGIHLEPFRTNLTNYELHILDTCIIDSIVTDITH